jgi:hypothetical protein
VDHIDGRQAFVEQAVQTILATGVQAVYEDDFVACVRSLDEAVAVYESNPSYVHASCSRFPSLLLFVHAARNVSEELGVAVNAVKELSERLDALRHAVVH